MTNKEIVRKFKAGYSVPALSLLSEKLDLEIEQIIRDWMNEERR